MPPAAFTLSCCIHRKWSFESEVYGDQCGLGPQELMMEMQGLVGYLATHSPLIIWRSAECKGDTAEWPVDVPDRPFWIGILVSCVQHGRKSRWLPG